MFGERVNLYSLLMLFVGLILTTTSAYARVQGLQEQPAMLKGMLVNGHAQEPVSGIELKIEGTAKTTRTDQEGRFSFRGLEPGTYIIVGSPSGYEEIREEVEVTAAGKELIIELDPK